MRRWLAAVCLMCVALCARVEAQVRLQPQPYPATIAVNEPWYLAGTPLEIFGDVYFPTGPTVFFKPNEMVPTVTYRGVTVYSDTTIEPYSIVYVPIGRGLLRPYERRRSGALAGTVGSTTPSFPIVRDSEVRVPVNPMISPSGAIDLSTLPPPAAPAAREAVAPPAAVGTAGATSVPLPPAQPTHMMTIERPRETTGVWIAFGDARWRAAGPPERMSRERFVRYGDYRSFDVFVDRSTGTAKPDRIYLPLGRGLVAPYERMP
jgi:hypothetical protein